MRQEGCLARGLRCFANERSAVAVAAGDEGGSHVVAQERVVGHVGHGLIGELQTLDVHEVDWSITGSSVIHHRGVQQTVAGERCHDGIIAAITVEHCSICTPRAVETVAGATLATTVDELLSADPPITLSMEIRVSLPMDAPVA